MGVQKCAHGKCNSDSRYKHKENMKDVKFFTFPFPDLNNDLDHNTMKCRDWIKACGRPADQLNVQLILKDKIQQKYYYKVCSKV